MPPSQYFNKYVFFHRWRVADFESDECSHNKNVHHFYVSPGNIHIHCHLCYLQSFSHWLCSVFTALVFVICCICLSGPPYKPSVTAIACCRVVVTVVPCVSGMAGRGGRDRQPDGEGRRERLRERSGQQHGKAMKQRGDGQTNTYLRT